MLWPDIRSVMLSVGGRPICLNVMCHVSCFNTFYTFPDWILNFVMDHMQCREKVCACCRNDSGKKPTRLMNENWETELKKLLPSYDRSDSRFPSGLCAACQRALSRMKSGNATTVPHFKPYDPAPINVDGRHKCTCFMCCKAKQPLSQFSPGKPKSPPKI